MRKTLIICVVFLLSWFSVISQSCLPEGIVFYYQFQLDSFPSNYPNCTEIEGDVMINGTISPLTNLDGLSAISSIGGNLTIRFTDLVNLHGLDNLETIGGNLSIENCGLPTLQGLDQLTLIGGNLFIIRQHMEDLYGLDKLNSIAGSFSIIECAKLSNFSGLGSLTYIGGGIEISYNDSLNNLSGFSNLIISEINGDLVIENNDYLIDLTGFEMISSINGNLDVKNNFELRSLFGLSNLVSVEQDLTIENNSSLKNLEGIDNLSSINGNLFIFSNLILNSLSGIDNVEASSIVDLSIYSNPSLSDCEVKSVCDYLESPNGVVEIHDNWAECIDRATAEDACEDFSIDERYSNNFLSLFPNPAYQEVDINLKGFNIDEIRIYTLTGHLLLLTREVNGTIDISDLQSGIYIVEVTAKNTKFRQKLIIQ